MLPTWFSFFSFSNSNSQSVDVERRKKKKLPISKSVGAIEDLALYMLQKKIDASDNSSVSRTRTPMRSVAAIEDLLYGERITNRYTYTSSSEFVDSESFDKMKSSAQMQKMLHSFGTAIVLQDPLSSPGRMSDSSDFIQTKSSLISYLKTVENEEEVSQYLCVGDIGEDSWQGEDMLELPSKTKMPPPFILERAQRNSVVGLTMPKIPTTPIVCEISVAKDYISDSLSCSNGDEIAIQPEQDDYESFMKMERDRLAPMAEAFEATSCFGSFTLSDYDGSHMSDFDGSQTEGLESELTELIEIPPELMYNSGIFRIGRVTVENRRDFNWKMTNLFKKYDANNDNFIGRNELISLYTQELTLELKDVDWEEIFKKMDRDNDMMSLKEFLKTTARYVSGDNLEELEAQFLKTQFSLFSKDGKISMRGGVRWIAKATGKASWTSRDYFEARVKVYGKKETFTEEQFITLYGAMKFLSPKRFKMELRGMGYRRWSKRAKRNQLVMMSFRDYSQGKY